ncbi:class I SAM-dependent DNA methyltransferase [Fredinandcohnia sp. 179-A 10B2 NHS]|uniref:class I SAM-dependent DNA methyltransferase n=1 Tax=Fredinandcohnia sp. 179-A 10B2 NHS TaxID=3235176 RepID=UPI0039A027BC
MSYRQFAYIYDTLMSDVDYDLWISFLEKKRNQLGLSKQARILDLACGTGSISIKLSKEGYEVVGVDLSEDMLTVANTKAMEAGQRIDFFQQNMAEIEGLQPFDIIVIFCDSLNYLQTEDEVQKTFQNVYNLLKDDGMFLFDVHSIYKMKHIFLDGPFVTSDEEVSYIWNCFEGPYPNSVEHELSFFVQNVDDLYQRFDEFHIQRTFHIDQYKSWLEKCGFEVIDITADFSETISETSERILFTVKKKG